LRKQLEKYCLFILLIAIGSHSFAQEKNKSMARYQIDAKRLGVYPYDKDALPRSREFIRLDSTYYVGWMLEGLYRYEHSGDYLGFKNAIPPLEKAYRLLEKDFGSVIKQIFSSATYYSQNSRVFDDMHSIAEALEQSYNTIERPDSTMSLMNKLEKYNFQKDYFDINCTRAWTYHRFRFYTSKDFSFLGNSIEENEKLAFKACFQQIHDIKKNEEANNQWFGWGQAGQDLLTVYHYLAIFHDYNQNYDSSEYYYNRLIDGGRVSWANYAHFSEEQGRFSDAFDAYLKPQYHRKYSLDEEDYYLPSILIYGARTKDAIRGCNMTLTTKGSVPGFGWYSMALARSYLYDAQLDSAEFYLDKAANFKELHINTTLTQSQYDFSVNLLKIQLLERKIQLIRFFDPGWWYSPTDLYKTFMLKLEKLMLEYAVVTALSNNPERDRLIYNLFCGESTVTFDESIYLLKDFSPPFFISKYEDYLAGDKRKRIHRYFKYAIAKFTYEDGEEELSARKCEEILNAHYFKEGNIESDPDVMDKALERLLSARLFEILSLQNEETANGDLYRNHFFEEFPQLVPFSGVKMKMNITFSGMRDEIVNQVIEELGDCNIEIITQEGIPKADVMFTKKGKYYEAVVNVLNPNGVETIVNRQILFKNPDNIGKELALSLFGKGGAVKMEK
jgi:hypothetical protein